MSPYLILAIIAAIVAPDPASELFYSKERTRRLSCEQVSLDQALQELPGRVRARRPRGDFVERDVQICRERVLRRGLRAPRDEAILDHLSQLTPDLVSAATTSRPDLADATWLVQVHYPNPQVASKIDFAAKNALVGEGKLVSDRTPLLSATDLRVITSLKPSKSYGVACKRYAQTKAMGSGDALLAIVSRDSQETTLHAGLCANGKWSWLQ